MVTILDLGAKSCIPCKMMTPILEKLENVCKEKAAIVSMCRKTVNRRSDLAYGSSPHRSSLMKKVKESTVM